MVNPSSWLLGVSLFVLLVILFYRGYQNKNWKAIVFGAGVLVIAGVMLSQSTLYTGAITDKGSTDDLYFLIILYIFMLIGMLASYAFKHFSHDKDGRKHWDWGLFLAPIFVSPMIFIPLYTAFQQTDSESPRLLMFLVAFQNGFL